MAPNWTYIGLAVSLFCLWGLRRLGVDDATADGIVSALVLGLGLAPSPVVKPKTPTPYDVLCDASDEANARGDAALAQALAVVAGKVRGAPEPKPAAGEGW